MKKIDLTGKKFGRLTVIKYSHNDKHNHKRWECICECGNIAFVTTSALNNNLIKSCGCGYKECLYSSKNVTHNMSKTRFYHIYRDMKYRCQNPNHNLFKNYGGRGITVCGRWLKFENFCDDMYESYKEHCDKYGKRDTSIDRTDNDGNYCPENCLWETWQNQANNRRDNHLITYKGQTLTRMQWIRKIGMTKSTFTHQLIRKGWSIEKIIKTLLLKQRTQITQKKALNLLFFFIFQYIHIFLIIL